MHTTGRPDFAKYMSEPKGERRDMRQWRDTTQIPDYIVGRPSAANDRFFEVVKGENLGYIFRLRTCEPSTEWNLENDYDWYGLKAPFYRIECFVKGWFTFLSNFSEIEEVSWDCISHNSFEPLGVIEVEKLPNEKALSLWISETIGSCREVRFQTTGKWSWAQQFNPVINQKSLGQGLIEPWTAMFEQQFAALVSEVLCVEEAPEVRQFVIDTMTGYREWCHFNSRLSTPMTILYGVPEDWDNAEFWSKWRSMGHFGELLFDFWARDIDVWWLDTMRKSGYTVALAARGSRLIWTPESEISGGSSVDIPTQTQTVEIPLITSASELRFALTQKMVLEGEEVSTFDAARRILYQNWELPIDYENYAEILCFYLENLDFWTLAESYLKKKSLALAMVPIRGRAFMVRDD